MDEEANQTILKLNSLAIHVPVGVGQVLIIANLKSLINYIENRYSNYFLRLHSSAGLITAMYYVFAKKYWIQVMPVPST